LVWEVADIDAARSWVLERGFRIRFEYDSSTGNASERNTGVYQLVLDPTEWFGFSVTLMQRGRPPS
jgi:predicted DNA-binding transcriptional regulator YafY